MPILRNLRAQRFALSRRERRKITHAEVASSVGVTRSHYSNVEYGIAPASEELAALLADYYGCDDATLLPLDYVAKGKPDKPPVQPQPKTTGPRKREKSDTKSPGRSRHTEAGAA